MTRNQQSWENLGKAPLGLWFCFLFLFFCKGRAREMCIFVLIQNWVPHESCDAVNKDGKMVDGACWEEL